MFNVWLALTLTYYAVGYALTGLAFRYFDWTDPRPGHKYDGPSFLDLYHDERFRPEGRPACRRALLWWWVGCAVIVALTIALALVSRAAT